MERNEACPEILLARLHLFIYLFPAILPFLSRSLPLSTSVALALSRRSAFHVSVWRLAGSVVSPSLSIFFCLTRFQKALYLLSRGSTTLCINLFNYAFIYAAVALCKCTLWLNKLFRCLAVCSPRWVFASDIMQHQQETRCLWCVRVSPICGPLKWWWGGMRGGAKRLREDCSLPLGHF